MLTLDEFRRSPNHAELTHLLVIRKQPVPFRDCTCCGKMLFKHESWIQCPDCGALSTMEKDTVYPLLSKPGMPKPSASVEWVASCANSLGFIKAREGGAISNASL